MLRLATINDAEAIRLLLSAAKEQIPLTSSFDEPKYIDSYLSELRKECKNDQWIVIEKNETIVAAMSLETSKWFDADYLIKYIVVSQSCRGKGLAFQLINYAKEQHPALWTQISPGNTSAFKLFGKAGFVKTDNPNCSENFLDYYWKSLLLEKQL